MHRGHMHRGHILEPRHMHQRHPQTHNMKTEEDEGIVIKKDTARPGCGYCFQSSTLSLSKTLSGEDSPEL